MKRFYLFTCIIIFHVSRCYSQEGDVQINELTSPALPAFVIMDISPDEISRPTTMKALTTSLQQVVGKSGFAEDIAIEFAPFWLKNKRQADFYDYYGIQRNSGLKKKHQFGRNAYETLAFSLGTSSYTAADSVKGKLLGIGIRTQWLSGKASDSLLSMVYSFLEEPAEIRAIADNLIDRIGDEDITENINIDSLISIGVDEMININNQITEKDKPSIKSELKDFFGSKTIGKSIQQVVSILKEIKTNYRIEGVKYFVVNHSKISQRVGFIFETAAAMLLDFPDNNFGFSYGRKAGFWATLNYRMPKAPSNDLMLMLRLIKSGIDFRTNSFDFGGRYSFSQNNFILGGEFLYRHTSEREKITFDGNEGFFVSMSNGFRFSVIGQYRLSDYIILNATFGKGFDTEITSGEIIAQLGVNFSLIQQQILNWK